jgi:hypothetical protein
MAGDAGTKQRPYRQRQATWASSEPSVQLFKFRDGEHGKICSNDPAASFGRIREVSAHPLSEW